MKDKKNKPKTRKPVPQKPNKVETPKNVYKRKKKHPKKEEEGGENNDTKRSYQGMGRFVQKQRSSYLQRKKVQPYNAERR